MESAEIIIEADTSTLSQRRLSSGHGSGPTISNMENFDKVRPINVPKAVSDATKAFLKTRNKGLGAPPPEKTPQSTSEISPVSANGTETELNSNTDQSKNPQSLLKNFS